LGNGVSPHKKRRNGHFLLRTFVVASFRLIIGRPHQKGATRDSDHFKGRNTWQGFKEALSLPWFAKNFPRWGLPLALLLLALGTTDRCDDKRK
jgi:hypothetical protein